MGRMQLAHINSRRAVNTGIDPSYRSSSEIKPHAARHREPQMTKRADEEVQEQHWPSAVAVDQEPAGRIADDRAQRLYQLEGNGLGERDAALLQDGRQHE